MEARKGLAGVGSESVRRRRRLVDWACRGIERLEGRVLLSVTTTVNHGSGFAGQTDLTLNGGTTITGNADPAAKGALQITGGDFNEARSAFTTKNQGVDSFDTTFTYIYAPQAPPDADGFTFTIEAGAPTAVGYLGYGIGYAGIDAAHPGIRNSVAIKFDLWKGGPVASETGLYANGVGIDANDAPETALTTTPAAIGTTVDLTTGTDGNPTGIDFHANATDTYQVHLVYGGGTTLTEALTDVTSGASVMQTFDLGGKTIPQIIGSHAAHVGFTGGTGGATSIQDITQWTYTGTLNAATPLNAPVLSGQSTLGGEIVLNYTSPGGQTGFEVDESLDGGATFQKVANTGAGVTTYSLANLDPTKTYQFRVKALGDQNTTFDSAFSNVLPVSAAGTPPTVRGQASAPGEVDLFFSTPFADRTGFEIDQSSDNGQTFQPIATLPAGATRYSVTGLDTSKTYQFEVTTLGNGTTTHNTVPSAPLTASGAGLASPTTIDATGGFTSASGLQLNGSAKLTGPTGTPPNAIRLVDGMNNEAGSAFFPTPQLIDSFDATYNFTWGATVPPDADGFTFALQNAGTTAVGDLGFGLGLTSVPNSFGVYINAYPTTSQTGLQLPGGRSQVMDLGNLGLDFHANPSDNYQVHLVYSGGTITETITDTTSGTGGTVTFPNVPIAQLVGSHAALVGFTGGTGGLNSEQDVLNLHYTGQSGGVLAAPVATAIACAPGVIDIGFNEVTPDTGGYDIQQSTDGGTTFTHLATAPAGAHYYEATGLNPATSYQFRVKALGNGSNTTDSAFSNVVSPTQPATAPQPIDFSGGFTSDNTGGLQLNGNSSLTGTGPTAPTPANALQITSAMNGESSSIFTNTPQLVGTFDTQFDFVYPAATATPADGFTFTLQTVAPTAIGTGGGGLGYGPDAVGPGDATNSILQSVAIKFDIYDDHGQGNHDATGLFVNGDGPTVLSGTVPEEQNVNMTPSGMLLGLKGHTYRAHLSYDGTTLHETVTDLTSNKTFTHDYAIDLSKFLLAGCAYVGFTGGTGGLNAEQDLLNWKFTGGTHTTRLPADFNNDGKVTFADLLILAQNYGKTSGATQNTGDANGDGKVTFADLLILAQEYGQQKTRRHKP